MYYEDKITRKSNLLENDSLSSYDNWAAQQNPNAFKVFHDFINDVRPARILEIGTSLGGFTSFLNYTCKKIELDCHIITYDINEFPWYSDMKKEGVDVRVENVFNESYSEVKQEVINFIKGDGITIVLCDGGSKIDEFNLLSNYIKIGDFIMAHDYARNQETFQNEVNLKLWNWHEISDSDIQEACDKNNLIDYKSEIFNAAVWTCRQKI
jgi:hypothetical protein